MEGLADDEGRAENQALFVHRLAGEEGVIPGVARLELAHNGAGGHAVFAQHVDEKRAVGVVIAGVHIRLGADPRPPLLFHADAPGRDKPLPVSLAVQGGGVFGLLGVGAARQENGVRGFGGIFHKDKIGNVRYDAAGHGESLRKGRYDLRVGHQGVELAVAPGIHFVEVLNGLAGAQHHAVFRVLKGDNGDFRLFRKQRGEAVQVGGAAG